MNWYHGIVEKTVELLKTNYQTKLDAILAQLENSGKTPSLLLHSCCAPCSSYVLEYLSPYFIITDFFYNPNISPAEEYHKRTRELQRLLTELPLKNPVTFVEGPYAPERFFTTARGHEDEDEGGARCFACYRLRLEEAAQEAQRRGCDYFTTTLSISPYKNAQKLNEIGEALAEQYGVAFLPSDFKKKEGYKRSIELSRVYHLYRQNYCGCIYSKLASERKQSL